MSSGIHRQVRRALVLALTSLTWACANRRTVPDIYSYPPDDGGPALMALEPRVLVDTSGGRVAGAVPFRYRNRGPGVAAVNEGRPWLERWDGTRWVRNFAVVELGGGPSMLVPVGAVRHDTVRFDHTPLGTRPTYPSGGPYAQPAEGRYRLVWGIHDAVNLDREAFGPHNIGPLRDASERTSNAFEIVAKPVSADYLDAHVHISRGLYGESDGVRVWRDGGVVRAERSSHRLPSGPSGAFLVTTRRIERPEAELLDLLLRLDSLSRHAPERPTPRPRAEYTCRNADARPQLVIKDATATRWVYYDVPCAPLPASTQAHLDALRQDYRRLSAP